MHSLESANPTRFDVAIVGKDSGFRQALMRRLNEDGYRSVAFVNGADMLRFVRTRGLSHLIMIDWREPDPGCLDILDALRKIELDTNVILVTSLNGEMPNEDVDPKLDLLELADILRGISSILRRGTAEGCTGHAIGQVNGKSQLTVLSSLGPIEFNESIQRAYWNHKKVNLTTTEYAIVKLLVSRAGTDVAYREMYDVVHGRDFVAGYGSEGYRANVRARVKRIRQKFHKIDPDFQSIRNYSGFGYRWSIRDGGAAPAR